MKTLAGLLLAIGLLACAVAFGPGCSMLQKPCQDPNSCECPTSQNPACASWPDDNGDNPSQMAKRHADAGADQ